MPEDPAQLIKRLFDAFNRRSRSEILALCHEEVEFMPVTGRLAGRPTAYRGREGLSQYLADVNRVWEELLVTVQDTYAEPDLILATGRVYARSRELGLRDLPVTWHWRLKNGLFVYGRVFDDPIEGLQALRADAGAVA